MNSDYSELTIEKRGSTALRELRTIILEACREVYAEHLEDPFFSLPQYWQRLETYSRRPGFTLVVGWIGNELVGYALGYTLPAESKWWSGIQGKVEASLLVEDGKRTFALTELAVRPQWRRRGYARALHGTLLRGRAETRATLLVLSDNTPARAAYQSWGWRKIGKLRPFEDAPLFDAMLLDLSQA